ncbi:EF-hand domain-containing protein [Phytomonospora sp. NPDC050363]|uniref:EF-hand domain-containing protein n=1 Tax=Phytomonospora sp. NPDC050363 TaxID=3155642 RepID=UPI0033E54C07
MAQSQFLDRKLARRFETYDSDGDGYIDRTDFALAGNAMGAAFGHAADSPARGRLLELLFDLWDYLATVTDADTDGQISLAEYRTAFGAGLLETPETFDAGYVPFLDAVMDIADADGDGRLVRDEHIRWTGTLMGLPEPVAGKVFDRLDTDGDGFVSREEILEAIRAFYFDDTPGSTGEWLLGPLRD